jgi:hypothetical protein
MLLLSDQTEPRRFAHVMTVSHFTSDIEHEPTLAMPSGLSRVHKREASARASAQDVAGSNAPRRAAIRSAMCSASRAIPEKRPEPHV